MIGAGTESMSMIPIGGNKIAANEQIFLKDENVGIAYGMGITAEKVAEQWKVSREAQDQFATESHRRALAAIEKGEFGDEITPYTVNERIPDFEHHQVATRSKVVSVDEGPRAGTTAEVPDQPPRYLPRQRRRLPERTNSSLSQRQRSLSMPTSGTPSHTRSGEPATRCLRDWRPAWPSEWGGSPQTARSP